MRSICTTEIALAAGLGLPAPLLRRRPLAVFQTGIAKLKQQMGVLMGWIKSNYSRVYDLEAKGLELKRKGGVLNWWKLATAAFLATAAVPRSCGAAH
jgi:hypothetical protein